MDIDIEFWLLILVAITGIATLIDKYKFEPDRKEKLATAQARGTLSATDAENILHSGSFLQMLRSLFPVFFLVVIIRSFFLEPFTIPSSSMEPTLLPGDFVFVNKFHYGIRLPGLKTKIIDMNEAKRGEVMVFRFPQEEKINYIKRVIGIPGDIVRYDGAKNLTINGERVPVENWQLNTELQVREGTEILPRADGEYQHLIRVDTQRSAATPGFSPPLEIEVPEGHYFTLGDNRDHSSDSRYWGLVEDRLVVGRAEGIWMHLDGWLPSFSRNGWIQ